MNIPFLDNWLNRRETEQGAGLAAALVDDPEGVAELFSECEMLRVHARAAGLELDGSPASLEALDQLMPRWRRDPEVVPWLGNDAGFYLGTVIVRTVVGTAWKVWPNGQPVIRLASGRELNVIESGVSWAMTGSPELSQAYAEASEG
ncbi:MULTISPECIES: DUF6278 family protein [Streptomyces]|uniref:DUF3806 domain-containing protein n=1 Tax=Streptomyces virginiae TaxID=1961 RepID=A0ABQ3NHG5_STRVG|nr:MULTISPECIES: DUF6278 family protein [Streptomyces]KJY16725.1 hypothetical protein VR43_33015 [Streptomyces sp. NRRL S-104]KOU22050.1 hypothetical protein ADK49_08925 [Streptomyces sp. WM6349]KOU29602.1 hypothetical protein ADK53_31185 [Streptomyces sp. WM6373]KOU67828.1 hypothetical protein ADK96_11445 [Streptomyces sp. IGB124]KOU70172.1 hypothetical protein ADK61_34740 [Streptomyces sp. XY66]